MTQPCKPKRIACLRCLRPERTCICHWIRPIDHAADVVILQHPLEVHNAKGSARLLHLSLPRSQLVTGEAFAEQELRELLYPLSDDARYPVLLYPEPPGPSEHPLFDAALLRNPAQIRLVVLDGTWRKSRKMLYQNPLLRQLPRLPLSNMPASQYAIRKAHDADQLSTLEAACYALMQLESSPEKYQRLLNAFRGFVAQQAELSRGG
jgi:DTW domain-containing protein YfiP